MKRITLVLAVIFAFGLVASTAQAAMFSDDFDSYSSGSASDPLKDQSTSWGGNPGGYIRNHSTLDPTDPKRVVKFFDDTTWKHNVLDNSLGASWTDYTVSADILLPSDGTAAKNVGLYFRIKPGSGPTSDGYFAQIVSGTAVRIWEFDAGSGTKIAENTVSIPGINDNAVHTFAVKVSGTNAGVYLDGSLLLSTTGGIDLFSSGRIGIRSQANNTGTQHVSYWDNVTVVPEPASLLLLGTGLLGLVAAVRKKIG